MKATVWYGNGKEQGRELNRESEDTYGMNYEELELVKTTGMGMGRNRRRALKKPVREWG